MLPGRCELPLPHPRVLSCAPANPPLRHGPCKRSWRGGLLAASATELRVASSWRTPAPGARCLLLLLPLFLTHFMTLRLRVTRLNTPLGRYGCVQGRGNVLGGSGFCSAISPLLGRGCSVLQGQHPSARGCRETLTNQSRTAAEGKAKLNGARAEGGDAEPLCSHPALRGHRRNGPGGPTL